MTLHFRNEKTDFPNALPYTPSFRARVWRTVQVWVLDALGLACIVVILLAFLWVTP